MAFELPPLPFAKDALEPHMSAKTLEFHHGKHHAAYVKTLNELIKGTKFENQPLEDIVRATAADPGKPNRLIFNNAGQAWNHSFFWQCLNPKGGGAPSGMVAKEIDRAFGGYDKFREEFSKAATTQFGSGWAWLVLDGGTLKVSQTGNAIDPLADGKTALLTLDVWEHAYYLDFQNRRPDFVTTFLDHLVNWDFVARNFEAARQHQKAA
jgi:superoxide dismutase, Fe-Mn family